ncbi:MAG TPA: glycosyltransferase family 4 protein [bacterium]|nr:glycosyltransferase family 4 protein [bacterium]HPG44796.1 glycosyltransferase family 4 protein [bacterium]
MKYRVLISAYACEPGKGSEPGIGWNIALHMARFHEIWVITRTNNRTAIENELQNNPVKDLHFIYYDLPSWARFWKKGAKGMRLYYYLWQFGAVKAIKKEQDKFNFDLGHHVTFGKYWTPSLFIFLKIPFLWGPVGGGESVPLSFWQSLGIRGIIYEFGRSFFRKMSEFDPFVRLTARRATITLATSEETSNKLRKLGVQRVVVFSQVGLSLKEINALDINKTVSTQVKFLSVGRLLAWKGFHLGIKAFASSEFNNCVYWIIGDGPEKGHLKKLVKCFELTDKVHFFDWQPRSRVLELLAQANVLIHPSLHESGGYVSAEAMAIGLPVICLDLGGPALQVTKDTGFKIIPISTKQTVQQLAKAMHSLEENIDLRNRMGNLGRKRIRKEFCWEQKAIMISKFYNDVHDSHR